MREENAIKNEEIRIINQKPDDQFQKTFEEIRAHKVKEVKERIKIEEFAIEQALETFSKEKFKAAFILNQGDSKVDPEERLNNCIQKAKEQCKSWRNDKLDDYNDLAIDTEKDKTPIEGEELNEEDLEGQNLNEDYEDELLAINRGYMKKIDEIQKDLSNTKNLQQTSKVVSMIHALTTSRGIVISGSRCSGKTTLIRILGLLLKAQERQIDMKISMLNPDVYDINKLYASADSGITNPEILSKRDGDTRISSITSSVLKIILDRFDKLEKTMNAEDEQPEGEGEGDQEVEKRVDIDSDDEEHDQPEVIKPKLMKTLLFESSNIDPLWSD